MQIRNNSMQWFSRPLALAILLAFTCFITISCGSTTAQTGSTEPNSVSNLPNEVIIATDSDYPPFDFLQNGKHVGFNQDLLDEIKQSAPLTIKQEILPWSGILAGIASGKYAATNASSGILEERARSFDFTIPTTELTSYYLKRKGDSSIQGIQDFAGKTIAVEQGGTSANVVEKEVIPELAESGLKLGGVSQYTTFAEAYQDLANQRVDVVINNIITLTQLVNEKPDLYELGQQVGAKVYAGWVVSKNNKPLLNFFNTEISKLKSNGRLSEIQQKWLGVTFDDLPDEPLLPGGVPIPQ